MITENLINLKQNNLSDIQLALLCTMSQFRLTSNPRASQNLVPNEI